MTHLFIAFLESCSAMRVKLHLILRSAPSQTSYGRISAYMEVIVSNQHKDDISETLTHLTHLCEASPIDLMQKRPFLMIAASFYIDAAVRKKHVFSHTNLSFRNLVNILLKACGSMKGTGGLSYEKGWTGMAHTIDAIYRHHNSSKQQPSHPANSTFLLNPNGHDNNV